MGMDKASAAEYLAAITDDLSKVANQRGFSTLSYILAMASEQASHDMMNAKDAAQQNCGPASSVASLPVP